MPYMDTCTDGCEWRSEDNFQELINPFQHGNSRDGTPGLVPLPTEPPC